MTDNQLRVLCGTILFSAGCVIESPWRSIMPGLLALYCFWPVLRNWLEDPDHE